MQHTTQSLKQMQAIPLKGKIQMTKRRISEWYEHFDGQVYVSFSGGKDSTVLKHIVDSMYDDVPAVFVNTGLEYPEIQQFVREVKEGKYNCFNPNVEILRPEMRFDEVIHKYGFPVVSKEISHAVKYARKIGTKTSQYYMQRFNGEALTADGQKSGYNAEKWKFLLDAPFDISKDCCDVMKKKPIKKYAKQKGLKPIIATMASESRLRHQKWIQHGCNAFDSKEPTSQPMSFWTEQDVLHYIKENDVPYASVYGDIVPSDDQQLKGQITAFDILGEYKDTPLKTTRCDRTGCIFCLFGCHLEKEPNRFQRLKQTHPKHYEYCIGGGEEIDGKWLPNKEGLGLAKVLDFINVKY